MHFANSCMLLGNKFIFGFNYLQTTLDGWYYLYSSTMIKNFECSISLLSKYINILYGLEVACKFLN